MPLLLLLTLPTMALGGMFWAESKAAEASTPALKYAAIAAVALSGAFVVWKLSKR